MVFSHISGKWDKNRGFLTVFNRVLHPKNRSKNDENLCKTSYLACFWGRAPEGPEKGQKPQNGGILGHFGKGRDSFFTLFFLGFSGTYDKRLSRIQNMKKKGLKNYENLRRVSSTFSWYRDPSKSMPKYRTNPLYSLIWDPPPKPPFFIKISKMKLVQKHTFSTLDFLKNEIFWPSEQYDFVRVSTKYIPGTPDTRSKY